MASFDADLDIAIRKACSVLSVNYCKDVKRVCLHHLLTKTDVLAVLPTGYGKSLIYQAWPIICSELARLNNKTWSVNSMILVVSPLIIIIIIVSDDTWGRVTCFQQEIFV